MYLENKWCWEIREVKKNYFAKNFWGAAKNLPCYRLKEHLKTNTTQLIFQNRWLWVENEWVHWDKVPNSIKVSNRGAMVVSPLMAMTSI